MRIRPCELRDANAFVERLHRHHKPVQGHRFSIRVEASQPASQPVVHGVLIAGRPVSRHHDPSRVLEVTRVCTDGTKNACSMLYGAAARIAREMGFLRIQTYILESEVGTTLKAAGWVYEADTIGRQWKHSDGKARRTDQPTTDKQRWGKTLNADDKIAHHQAAYEAGKPTISDQAYDLLVGAQEPPLGPAGSVPHAEPMLSLGKVYTPAAFQKWRSGIRGSVVATPKLDGIALCLTYLDGVLVKAMTRGDGKLGEDVTDRVHVPRQLALPYSCEVRGEAILAKSKFTEGANPRNVAVGMLATGKPLYFFAYDVRPPAPTHSESLELAAELGFTVVPFKVDEEPRAGLWDLDYEMDGVVVTAQDAAERDRLGETNHHPRWAVAWKFQGDSGVTTVREVVWQVSRFGALTPVAVVDPVQLSGVSVTRCTLHNLDRIRELKVTVGSTVIMTRRGGVIPHIEEVMAGEGTLEIPVACPSCGTDLFQNVNAEAYPSSLKCYAPNCPEMLVARLEHFLKTTKVDGWGPTKVRKLVDDGVVEPADLYLLTYPIPGLRREMDRAMFVEALGLDGLGSTKAANTKLADLPDLPWIRRLREVVTVREPVVQVGTMSGKVIVFTGELTKYARPRAQALVRAQGGETPSGVSKKVTHLVVGSSPGNDKTSKAKKLGVPEITEEQFLEMLGDVQMVVMAVDLGTLT